MHHHLILTITTIQHFHCSYIVRVTTHRHACQLFSPQEARQHFRKELLYRYMPFSGPLFPFQLPVLETQMCQFVAFLKEEGLRHQAAKSYLSAVWHLQISQGYGYPKMSSMPRLELVIRGMKRLQASLPTRPRLPITPDILWKIRARWDRSQEWDHIMLWATMCLCFFGFLRSGEAVAPDTGFDPSQHYLIKT